MLEALNRYLYVIDNGVVSLSGLDNLKSVPSFILSDNQDLTGLEALAGMESVSSLMILGNTSLPACEAQSFADRVAAGADFVQVMDNGGGTCD